MSREFRIFRAAVGTPRPEPPDLFEAIRRHAAEAAATKFIRKKPHERHAALSAPPDVTPAAPQRYAAPDTVPEPPDLAAAIRAARSQE